MSNNVLGFNYRKYELFLRYWRRRFILLEEALSSPSKHLLQQSGKSQIKSGSSPPQSEKRSSKMNSSLRLHTEEGMTPTSLLPCSKNSFSSSNSPDRMEGTVPVSSLPFKYRSRKIGGSEYCLGIDPLNKQLDMYTNCTVGTEKIELGILPVN
jgi:hypothetical protein